MAVMVLKRTLRALPLVGLIAGPLLALAPTILVGPVLGMAVVYGLEKGDMTALHSRLFGQGGAPSGAAPAANPSRGSR